LKPALILLDRADTLSRALVTPDAFWFLRAELLRDSLGAPRPAALAFAEMAVRFPRSPWTAKALVAAIAAGHPAPDSLRVLLEERYGESPYTLALLLGRAEAAERYAALEDSLQRSLGLRAIPRRPGEAGAQNADDDADTEERVGPRRPAVSSNARRRCSAGSTCWSTVPRSFSGRPSRRRGRRSTTGSWTSISAASSSAARPRRG